MTRYIVIGQARSGTTVTHLCLAGHPNVSVLSDEVKTAPFFTEGISVFTFGNEHEHEFKKGFSALFDALCTLNMPEELLACGLKTAVSSASQASDFVRSVQTFFPEVKIVLTVRDDIVAQFGSLELAKATGRWHSWIKSDRETNKININNKSLSVYAINSLKTVDELKRLKNSHEVCEISYENDILTGELLGGQRLFRFLGLPPAEVTWLRSKKVAPPPAEYIVDFEQHTETVQELRQRFEDDPGSFSASLDDRYIRVKLVEWVRRKFNRA